MSTWLPSKNSWLLIALIAVAAMMGVLVSLNFDWTIYLAIGLLALLLPLMFLRPFWGLIALLVMRPALDIFGQTMTISLPFRENLTINLASLIAIIVIIWGIIYLLKNPASLKTVPLLWPILILLAIGLISILVSADRFVSFAEWIRWLSIAVIFLIAFDLARRTGKGRPIIGTIAVSVTIPIAVSFWQLVNNTGIFEISTGLTRVYGTFGQPNSLAFFLVLIAAILIIFWQSGIGKKTAAKWLLLIPAVAVLVVLFFTYTRGAWLALIIILLILGIQRWRWKFVTVLLIIVAVLSLFILFSSQNTRVTQFNITRTDFYQRIVTLFNFDEYSSSTSWRVRMWSDLMTNAFPEKPWFGYELGMYVPTNLVVHGYLEGALEAHNDYLLLLIETGLIGLAAYIFLIASTLIQIIRTAWHRTGNDKKTAWIVAALLMGIFAMSFGDNILRVTALQWALWSLVAAVLATNNKVKSEK